ncbi:hypothetical protein KAR91_01490, partial [Candidatus Pacearchaeota archaeon]|nr:hypothetical protein [Candidatus Pacearchaeota archaeon]
MRPTHLKHLTAALITLVVTVPLTWAAVSSIRVGNPAPVFEELPSDGGAGSLELPLYFGETVSFTAMATDVNGDGYYLALCKTDAITPVDGGAPTCDGGAWMISDLTLSGQPIDLDYVVQKGAERESEWFAFACDHVEFGSSCSQASQGALDETGSPFYVHKQVGVLRYGADCPDVVELDNLKQELEENFEDPITFLSEELSKKDIRDLLDEALAGDKKEVNRHLRLVAGHLDSLDEIQKNTGSVKKAQKDAVVDALLAKRAKFKKMEESNVRFCITSSTDDSIENVVGKADKKFEVKNEHKVDKRTL